MKRWIRSFQACSCASSSGAWASNEQLAELDAEGKQHGDILTLPNADGRYVADDQGYHWWRAAGAMLPPPGSERGLKIAAKVDDDNFRMSATWWLTCRLLRRAPALWISVHGLDPSIWRLCGWSWQPHGRNYHWEAVHSVTPIRPSRS